MRKVLIGMFVTISITACSTAPVYVPDTTPQNPTAIIEQEITNNGIKGFFPFSGTDKHLVRADMRRDESTLKGTGTFSSFIIGTHSGTKISRIDRNLLWTLNTDKSEYTECPLKGCPQPVGRPTTPSAENPPQAAHESGCTMSIARSNFTVKSTGQKKSINSFDSDEYQVAWIITLRDKAAQTSTSTLNINLWTTQLTPAMRDTLAIEDAYNRAYNSLDNPAGKRQLLPADAAKLISGYLANSMKAGDLSALLDAGKQMEKIKGYPILTHLTWDLQGNACASKQPKKNEEKSSTPSMPTSIGGAVSSLTGMFVQKKTDDAIKDSAGEPLLSFTMEVKSLKTEPQHDSVFTVPAHYKLVQP